jgi:tight adherence protein C
MLHWKPILSSLVFLAMFGVTYAAGIMMFLWAYGDRKRALSRLRDLAHDNPAAGVETSSFNRLAGDIFSRIGAGLFPKEGHLGPLRKQLVQAGFYRPNGAEIFFGVKLALMVLLFLLSAVSPFLFQGISLPLAGAVSLGAAAGGMIAPNLWLEREVLRRQSAIRQALPDALDMLVLCLEGGISIAAAFQRVTDEVQEVHPVMRGELAIVQREIQLGLTTGEALRKMAERTGIEEIRELAAVLLQSERYGVSMVKALRMHADSWRQERYHHLEAMAQKTAVKILFPTLLCIFPAIFIVLLGPAAFQLSTLFMK